jgi:biotin operon repressor
MSMMLMAKAFGIKVGNASRKLVLIKLADNANDQGECWPSYQHIADQCEMSRRSAMNHIDALCESGLVVKRTRKGVKGNSSNVYFLNLDGEKSAPWGSANNSLGGEASAPGGGENSAPGISHSFEPVTNPSHSGERDSHFPQNVFERAAQQADDGEPAADDLSQPRKTAMHLEWEPEPETYATACWQRGLAPDANVHDALLDFREHFAAQPARTATHADWTRRFVRWVAENAKRQQTALTNTGGNAHANRRSSTPKRRLTAQEARAAHEGRAPEPPGQTLDGEYTRANGW